jgi:subtilisin family serine protease
MAPDAPPDAVPPILDLPERPLVDAEGTRRSADAQAGEITRRWNDWRRGDRTVSELITNRNSRAGEVGRYLAVQRAGRRDDEPLVARDELLLSVRELGRPLVRHLVQDGFEVTPVPELDNRVFTVRRAKGRPSAVTVGRAVDAFHRGRSRPRGGPPPYELGYHYLAPMGVVVKADCGPEPSPGFAPQTPVESSGTRVAVIDTGITDQVRTDGWLAHTPVGANVDLLDDFAPFGLLDHGAGHGTFVAAVIEQIAPTVVVDVHRALDSDGLGGEAAAASAMVRAAKAGASIINLSFGLETDDDRPPVALAVAVDIIRTRYPDVLLVAAAGNFGRSTPCWPAAFKGVTAVGALTRTLDGAPWSSRGSWVDVSTIGEAVLSTYVSGEELDGDRYPADAWAVWSGTSFAAPQIVGAVALLGQRLGIGPRDALARLVEGREERADFGRIVQILPPR